MVSLLPPFHVQILGEHEGIAVDLSGLREDDGLAVVEAVVPSILPAERIKPPCGEILVEREPRHGGLYQLHREVPGVEPVERRHLPPGGIPLRGDARTNAVAADRLGIDRAHTAAALKKGIIAIPRTHPAITPKMHIPFVSESEPSAATAPMSAAAATTKPAAIRHPKQDFLELSESALASSFLISATSARFAPTFTPERFASSLNFSRASAANFSRNSSR